MKKQDWFLIILLFIIFGMLPFFISLKHTSGEKVKVCVDNNLLYTYDITEDGVYTVSTQYGFNKIEINDRCVTIIDSDCLGKDCIKCGSIKTSGKHLICLPHHLDVYIDSVSNDVDGVAY